MIGVVCSTPPVVTVRYKKGGVYGDCQKTHISLHRGEEGRGDTASQVCRQECGREEGSNDAEAQDHGPAEDHRPEVDRPSEDHPAEDHDPAEDDGSEDDR
jgi:hypothetical protein